MNKEPIQYPLANDFPSSQIEEPVALFGAIDTRQQVITQIKEGLPTKTFEVLREEFGVPMAQLAKTLNINLRTLTRRKQSGRFNTDESERVYRLGRLFQIALNLFQDEKLVQRWFSAPKECFNGETPLNYADTEPGAQEVEKQLRRLEHGVFC